MKKDRGSEGQFLYDVNAHSWVWSDPGGSGYAFFLGKTDNQKYCNPTHGSKKIFSRIEKWAPMGSIFGGHLGVLWECFFLSCWFCFLFLLSFRSCCWCCLVLVLFFVFFVFGFACMLWLVMWWLISVVYLCSSGSVAVEFSSEAFNHFEWNCHGSMHGRALFFVFSSYCRVAWIRWMDGWIRWMDGWDGRMDGWMNWWMGRQDGWKDRKDWWMDGWIRWMDDDMTRQDRTRQDKTRHDDTTQGKTSRYETQMIRGESIDGSH